MLASSRFAVAVHSLVVLAKYARQAPVCSSFVASSVNTNPVVIRRLMIELERAGLVTSSAGRAGGFSLGRAAERISLVDIYRAVETEGVFRVHKVDPKSICPVSTRIIDVLSTPLEAAETALESALARTSLADLAQRIAA